jgi:4-hydroxy-tetrahydrodipicolinate reductase
MTGPPYRVIQWATGNVGRQALRAILDHPDLELAGVLVTNPAKVGRDAGELVGRPPAGVRCTASVDEVLALDADCVAHMPLPSAQVGDDPDRDARDLCRILAAGKNAVTTVGFVYPAAHGPELVTRLEAACRAGGASLHGTGANPGFLGELLPLTFSALSARIDEVVAVESSEFSGYPSQTIVLDMMGFGAPPHEFERVSRRFGDWLTGLFAESVHLVAAGLGAVVERVERELEVREASEDLVIAAGPVPKGTIGAQRWSWRGVVAGRPRIRLDAVYRAHPSLAPEWGPLGAELRIEGKPRMRLTLGHDWLSNGLTATALHAVHAIPHVCRAAPGIRTFLDLPLITGRGTLAGAGAPA